MKLYLTDQTPRFPEHLKRLSASPVIPYRKEKLRHKIMSAVIPGHTDLSTLDLKDFWDYRIFPPGIMQAYPQWRHEHREIRIGDTIVQQIQIPPFLPSLLSLKIIAGARINEIYNTATCQGFSYETLSGHVEKGVSAFRMEQKEGGVSFTIETYSAPNGVLLSLGQPMAGWYQDYCTRKAVGEVGKILV